MAAASAWMEQIGPDPHLGCVLVLSQMPQPSTRFPFAITAPCLNLDSALSASFLAILSTLPLIPAAGQRATRGALPQLEEVAARNLAHVNSNNVADIRDVPKHVANLRS